MRVLSVLQNNENNSAYIKVLLDKNICVGDKCYTDTAVLEIEQIDKNGKVCKNAKKGEEVYIRISSTNLPDIKIYDELKIVTRYKEQKKTAYVHIEHQRIDWGKYQRLDWERAKPMKDFLNRSFKGRKTYRDDYTDVTLHKNSNAAKNKYGLRKAKYHNPSVDHIMALKNIHEFCEKDFFAKRCPREKAVKIANSPPNFVLTSRSNNSRKGAKNGEEFVKSLGLDGTKIGDNIKGKSAKTETEIKNQLRKEGAKALGEDIAVDVFANAIPDLIFLIKDAKKRIKNGEDKKQVYKNSLKNFLSNTGENLIYAVVDNLVQ